MLPNKVNTINQTHPGFFNPSFAIRKAAKLINKKASLRNIRNTPFDSAV